MNNSREEEVQCACDSGLVIAPVDAATDSHGETLQNRLPLGRGADGGSSMPSLATMRSEMGCRAWERKRGKRLNVEGTDIGQKNQNRASQCGGNLNLNARIDIDS